MYFVKYTQELSYNFSALIIINRQLILVFSGSEELFVITKIIYSINFHLTLNHYIFNLKIKYFSILTLCLELFLSIYTAFQK